MLKSSWWLLLFFLHRHFPVSDAGYTTFKVGTRYPYDFLISNNSLTYRNGEKWCLKYAEEYPGIELYWPMSNNDASAVRHAIKMSGTQDDFWFPAKKISLGQGMWEFWWANNERLNTDYWIFWMDPYTEYYYGQPDGSGDCVVLTKWAWDGRQQTYHTILEHMLDDVKCDDWKAKVLCQVAKKTVDDQEASSLDQGRIENSSASEQQQIDASLETTNLVDAQIETATPTNLPIEPSKVDVTPPDEGGATTIIEGSIPWENEHGSINADAASTILDGGVWETDSGFEDAWSTLPHEQGSLVPGKCGGVVGPSGSDDDVNDDDDGGDVDFAVDGNYGGNGDGVNGDDGVGGEDEIGIPGGVPAARQECDQGGSSDDEDIQSTNDVSQFEMVTTIMETTYDTTQMVTIIMYPVSTMTPVVATSSVIEDHNTKTGSAAAPTTTTTTTTTTSNTTAAIAATAQNATTQLVNNASDTEDPSQNGNSSWTTPPRNDNDNNNNNNTTTNNTTTTNTTTTNDNNNNNGVTTRRDVKRTRQLKDSVVPVIVCPCKCSNLSNILIGEFEFDESRTVRLTKEIEDSLRVDPTNVSYVIRSKTSATDHRVTARVAGVLGICIIITCLIGIVIMDAQKLYFQTLV